MRVTAIVFVLLGVTSLARGAAPNSFVCKDADATFCTTNSVTKGSTDCLTKPETAYKCLKTCGFCQEKKNRVQDNIKCIDKSSTCAADATDAAACDAKPELKLACCQTCLMKKLEITGTLKCTDVWDPCASSTGTGNCCPHAPSKPNKTDSAGRKNYKTRCRTDKDTMANCMKTCDMCTTNKNNASFTRIKCADKLKKTAKKKGCRGTDNLPKCTSDPTGHAIGSCCATCIFEAIKTKATE